MSAPVLEPLSRRDRWILALVFALAFALRVVATLQYEAHHPNAAHPAIDEASYDRWARAIAGGDWIGHEVFFQEPLYPYALGATYAVFGPHALAARLLQCALWAATAVIVGLLARRLFGRAAGFVAALAIALYQPGLLFPSLLLKENLFLPLFALLALVLVQRRWLAVGLLAGAGALLRGNMLVLIPLLVLWPIARREPKRLLRAGSVLAGAACVLLPVALRNFLVGGVFLLTTSGAGTNLYGGNNLENPYGRASEFSFLRGIPEHEAGDWRREAERRVGRPLDPSQVSAFWRDEALRSAREHPREHLAILWNKLRLTLGRYEVPDNHFLPWDARYVPFARAPWPAFGAVGMLGVVGLVLLLVQARRTVSGVADPAAVLDLALLFALYLGTIVLTVTSDRARLPLVVPLACFAGFALAWIVRAARARDPDAIVRLAFALFCGALVVHVPVLSATEIAEDFDERDFNLAAQGLRQGEDLDGARAIAARLVETHPQSARSRLLLAEIDFRRAGAEGLDAILARVEPLADAPSLNARERFRARSLAGWIQLRRGAFGAAEDRFRQALEFDGESADLRNGLALSRIGGAVKRFDAARVVLDGVPRDDAQRKAAQDAVNEALKTLQGVVESDVTPPDARAEARLSAGSIQLWRGNWKPAENHFRAAQSLRQDARADLGLLQALIGSLEASPTGEHRVERIDEVSRLLQGLRGTVADAAGLDGLAARVERLR